MPFDDCIWEKRFQELLQYKEKHGHMIISKSASDGKLRDWVYTQRKARDSMRSDRRKRLNSIDFDWQSVITVQRRWKVNINKLRKIFETRGHCEVHRNDTSLKYWCAEQRRAFQEGTLNVERLDQLNKLKFRWKINEFDREILNSMSSDEVSEPSEGEQDDGEENKDSDIFEPRYCAWAKDMWESKYKKLKRYYDRYGHTCVPVHYDSSLHKWVCRQRELKGEGKLARSRETKLDELSFVYSMKKLPDNERHWYLMLQRLQAFKEQHGHCRVLKNDENDVQLGLWVTEQRRKGASNPAHKVILDKIGFEWAVSDDNAVKSCSGLGKRKHSKISQVAKTRKVNNRDRKNSEVLEVSEVNSKSKAVRDTRASRKAQRRGNNLQNQITNKEELIPEVSTETTADEKVNIKVYKTGTKLVNFFPGHGWFEGTITSISDGKYKVKYSDGDIEEFLQKDFSVDALVELARCHSDLLNLDSNLQQEKDDLTSSESSAIMELQVVPAITPESTPSTTTDADEDTSGNSLQKKVESLLQQLQQADDHLKTELKKQDEMWQQKVTALGANKSLVEDESKPEIEDLERDISVSDEEVTKLKKSLLTLERKCKEKDNRIRQLNQKIAELEQNQFVAGSVGQKILSRLQGKRNST
jgi:Helicase associated domain